MSIRDLFVPANFRRFASQFPIPTYLMKPTLLALSNKFRRSLPRFQAFPRSHSPVVFHSIRTRGLIMSSRKTAPLLKEQLRRFGIWGLFPRDIFMLWVSRLSLAATSRGKTRTTRFPLH